MYFIKDSIVLSYYTLISSYVLKYNLDFQNKSIV